MMGRQQINKFRRMWPNHSDRNLSTMFQMSLPDILKLRKMLGLNHKNRRKVKPRPMPRWKPEEVEKLREIFPDTPSEEVCRILGKSMKSIVSKAHNMGVKKSKARMREMGLQNLSKREDRDEHGHVILKDGTPKV